jgi:inosine-uridine nucleoside N-ribohydrolase
MKALFSLFAAFLILCSATPFFASERKIPVLLDTDIGTDIDDAFALALIMKSSELRLLGVTTVSGDAQARARLAAKMLWVAGGAWRKVPVYAGQSTAAQPIAQTAWSKGFNSPALHLTGALEFMRNEVDRHPGEIIIISIGEETNLAALLRSEPGVKGKIKMIALMGGSIARGYAPGSPPEPEWNIKSNPAAAQVVFSSGIPLLVAPLDVTAMLQLDPDNRQKIFSQHTPVADALAALYKLWGQETPTLFDPMAVAMLANSGICETQKIYLEVDSRGMTNVVQGKPANATVGMKVDAEKFKRFYVSCVAP